MDDTTPFAHDAVRDAVLRLAPADRVRDMLAFSERMRELSFRRLRIWHPDYSTLELVELLLGHTLIPAADRARFVASVKDGPAPEDAGRPPRPSPA